MFFRWGPLGSSTSPPKPCLLYTSYTTSTKKKAGWTNKEWFEKKFIPQVREHLKSQNIPQKAVLLIDNAPSHPGESVFKSENGNFFVKFLPPNVTALIQPMDQGVIASMKTKYRTNLLKKRIEEGNDLQSFWKDYTILASINDIDTCLLYTSRCV